MDRVNTLQLFGRLYTPQSKVAGTRPFFSYIPLFLNPTGSIWTILITILILHDRWVSSNENIPLTRRCNIPSVTTVMDEIYEIWNSKRFLERKMNDHLFIWAVDLDRIIKEIWKKRLIDSKLQGIQFWTTSFGWLCVLPFTKIIGVTVHRLFPFDEWNSDLASDSFKIHTYLWLGSAVSLSRVQTLPSQDGTWWVNL